MSETPPTLTADRARELLYPQECPQCRERARRDANYCSKCGHELTTA